VSSTTLRGDPKSRYPVRSTRSRRRLPDRLVEYAGAAVVSGDDHLLRLRRTSIFPLSPLLRLLEASGIGVSPEARSARAALGGRTGAKAAAALTCGGVIGSFCGEIGERR
jgi:hypothetical protein